MRAAKQPLYVIIAEPTPARMSLLNRSGLDTRSWLKALKASAPVLLAAIVGLVLSWLALRIASPQTDHDATLAIYQLGGTPGTLEVGAKAIWYVASAGNVVWMPLVFWLFVFRKNKFDWTSAAVLAVAVAASMVSSDILKVLFHLPRPFASNPCLLYPCNSVARVGMPTNFAFPSGHTTQAFTVLAVVWRRYKPWRLPFLALALGTGIGMMVVGLHFLSDVTAGAFLGIISGAFATSLGKLRSEPTSVTGQRVLG